MEYLDGFSYVVLRFVLKYLWQSSIVLIAALLMVYILKRYSTSFRYYILLIVFAASPLLPIISGYIGSIGAPQMKLIVIESSTETHTANLFGIKNNADPAPPLQDHLLQTSIQKGISIDNTIIIISAFILIFASLLTFNILVMKIKITRWIRTGRNIRDLRIKALFDSAAKKLRIKRKFSLIESGKINAPCTAGIIRPVILLPESLPQKLSDEELTYIALHELAHIKRRDPLIFSLISILRSLTFFSPLTWIVSGQIVALAEKACDEIVINSTKKPLQYAKTLSKIAENISLRRWKMELSPGILFSKSAFLNRISSILSNRKDAVKKISGIKFLMSITILLLTFGIALSAPMINESARDIIGNQPEPADQSSNINNENINGNIQSDDGIEPGMTVEEVLNVLGKPYLIIPHKYDDSKQIYVWQYKKHLFTTSTRIIVFREGEVKMITNSSGKIGNPEKYVYKTENESQKEKISYPTEIYKDFEDLNGWATIAHIENKFSESVGNYIAIDTKAAAVFDSIKHGMTLEEVQNKIGIPKNKRGSSDKSTGIWEIDDNVITLEFRNNKVFSKALKKGKTEILVKRNYWEAKEGKNSITTITED